MLKKSIYLIAFISFCLNLVCSKVEENYTVEIKDGVRYVHNNAPAWGDTLKVELEFVQKIGELDATDENYMLYRVADIALDSEGNIYVLDAGNYRIQKYDSEGKYLNTFGREGQGLGEFGRSSSFALDSSGNMYIADQGNSRVVILTPEGKELRTFKASERIKVFELLLSEELLVGTIADGMVHSYHDVEEYEQPVVQIYNSEGVLKREFVKPFDYNDGFFNAIGNAIDFTFDHNNTIYLSFENQNRIEKYSHEGKLLFSADRTLSFEVNRPKAGSRLNNVSNGIGIDYIGRIWVMTYRKQREKDDLEPYLELEIYENDGILLGEIPWTEDFIPALTNSIHMFGDRVFFRNSEAISVYEYKIVEK